MSRPDVAAGEGFVDRRAKARKKALPDRARGTGATRGRIVGSG